MNRHESPEETAARLGMREIPLDEERTAGGRPNGKGAGENQGQPAAPDGYDERNPPPPGEQPEEDAKKEEIARELRDLRSRLISATAASS